MTISPWHDHDRQALQDLDHLLVDLDAHLVHLARTLRLARTVLASLRRSLLPPQPPDDDVPF